MDTLFQDIRYGIRMLMKSPGFTTVAIITLALGIGANTAIFSIVNAVLLRPLPFPDSGRLMFMTEMADRDNGVKARAATSYPDFFDWRAQNHAFTGISSYHEDDFSLTGIGDPQHLSGETVSHEFFSVLGVTPMLGRGFLPEEEKPGTRVVVLSHQLWQSTFAADRAIIGRSITLNQQSYQVVGVMPDFFSFPVNANPPRLWRTLATDAESSDPVAPAATASRGSHFLSVVGRLQDNVSVTQAREQMNLIAAALAKQYPDTNKRHPTVDVTPELEYLVGDRRPALAILALAVFFLLAIACLNVANLLLARANSRGREIAVRAALGAAKMRVVRQLMTESFLLSLGGAMFALPLASWAIKLFLSLNAQKLPRMSNAGIDGRVLIFTAVVAVMTSVIFGLVPALRSANPNLLQFMKEGGRGTSAGSSHQRLRSALVVAETAIGLVLLVVAGLLLRSFHQLVQVDPGFNPKNVLTFNFDLPDSKYPPPQAAQFYRQLLERLRALPGVRSASGVAPVPLSDDNMIITFQIEGHPVPKSDEPFADVRFASPDYFRTAGIPLMGGRDFSEHDDMQANRVVIVSQSFARRYFPNENPVGKHITPGLGEPGGKNPAREIIGVVGDTKHRGLNADLSPTYYVPYSQVPGAGLIMCLKTAGDPQALTSAVKKEVAAMDRSLPLYNIRTMEDYVAASVAEPRFHATLLECFAFLALVLTAIGIYGVVAYSVVQRTQEIGIRMTLGAPRSTVLQMILKAGLRLTIAGVVIGAVIALVITQLLKILNNMLFQVKPHDVITFAWVILILGAVSLLASYIPAWRATRVDPMVALRYE
jgi:putative ABC transport system permease protein